MEWNKDTIQAFRKNLCLTQYQFAELLNTSNVLISYWENGKKKPAGISQKALSLVAEKEDIERDIEEIKSKTENRISSSTIRAFREKLGLNQTQFASKLRRDLSTISYWESGERGPGPTSRRRLKSLAEEKGMDLEELAKEVKEGQY